MKHLASIGSDSRRAGSLGLSKRRVAALAALALVAFLGAAPSAQADYIFNCTWSGVSNGNSASATGTIAFKTGLPANPDSSPTTYAMGSDITALSVTVTGASAGNGTFTMGDFTYAYWNTMGSTLDFGRELVGQSIGPGVTWGTAHDGSAGDFNLFAAAAPAPNGTTYFQLTSNASDGDAMYLTSMIAVPEPTTTLLFALGIGAMVVRRRVCAA